MTANLFDSKAGDYIISGPQFDMDPQKVQVITYTFVSVNEETVYNVPPGKTFYISKIIMKEVNGAQVEFRFKIDGQIVYHVVVGASTTSTLDFNSPLPAKAGQVLTADFDGIGNEFILIGWEL